MRLVVDLQAAQGESRMRGIGRYSRELALAMARAPGRHEIEIMLNTALPFEDLMADLEAVMPQQQIILWAGPRGVSLLRDQPGTAAAAALVRAEAVMARRPDMLHVASVFEGVSDDVIARWPASRPRPPTMATCYDLIPLVRREDYLDGPWRETLRPWYLRQLHEFALSDGLLAISESSRGEATGVIGYPAERVFNIRAGVSPSFAPPTADAAADAALRQRYGLPEAPVLFVGAGDRRKNEAGLVRGFARLPEATRARHKLVIVGRTDAEALQRLAASEGLTADSLVLVPFVEEADLARLYAICGVFVLPSLHEGFGLPAVEAMACGAPTIGSNATSVPEVIGRPDALFDPLDPASIAERIAAVLEDPLLRQSLRAHGIRHAAQFTWAEAARRAWDACEAVAAGMPAAPVVLRRRLPRLALSAPLPPQESGIATYTAELAPALARHYDITLVGDRATTDDERLAHAFDLVSPDTFLATAQHYDRVLYQLGNSTFHMTQLTRLLPAVPGVVVLHDAFLANVWNLHLAAAGDAAGFQRLLLRSHGWAAVAADARLGREATLRRYPCSLDVVQDACGLILHSEHARDVLAAHFGADTLASADVIAHLRRPPSLPDRAAARRRLGVPDDTFLICSFGAVAPTKMPELALSGWRAAGLGERARLVFVGEAGAQTGALFTQEMSAQGASVTGRVDGAVYAAWLAAADAAIQLRTSSRGESSGAVADCLGAGLPLIVNAHGSAAELPAGTCLMLPAEPNADEVGAALHRMAQEAPLRAGLATQAQRHAATQLAPHRVADRYAEAIETAWARTGLHRTVRDIRATPSCAGANPVALAVSLGATFPQPGPRSVFVDGEAMLHAGRGGDLANWLANHPSDIRVHPVALAQGRLKVQNVLAARLLGLEATPGLDDWAEPRPGDVLLAGAAMTDEGVPRRLALLGVTVHRVDRALARGEVAEELAFLTN